LLRDCLLFEDGDRLVLFGGVSPEWFRDAKGMEVVNAPTYFGDCSVRYSFDGAKDEGTLEMSGSARPGAVSCFDCLRLWERRLRSAGGRLSVRRTATL
jgi:hypothetical protein